MFNPRVVDGYICLLSAILKQSKADEIRGTKMIKAGKKIPTSTNMGMAFTQRDYESALWFNSSTIYENSLEVIKQWTEIR